MLPFEKEVGNAYQQIKGFIRETPLEHSPSLSKLIDGQVFLKLENIQKTGSFKFRGALNKMTSLTEQEKSKGIVTASTGNHGAACSLAMGLLHIKGTIVVPKDCQPNKVENIRALGGMIEYFGDDSVDTERRAREIAKETGATYIPPYNDRQIIYGQGTIGYELFRQAQKNIDSVIGAVGGGGMIAGIGSYLQSVDPKIKMIGVSPKNSCVMHDSLKAGKLIDAPSKPTLSDGTAGGVEQGSITFPLCQKIINEFVLVSEQEIAKGILMGIDQHHLLIEGSAGAAIAGFLQFQQHLRGQTVIIIICGSNIGSSVLKQIFCHENN